MANLKKGRLEGRITVPSGGWDITGDNGSSSSTETIAAGDYYLTSGVAGGDSFLAAIASALSTATGDTVTVTLADGESVAAGDAQKVTIATDGPTIDVTFDDTEIQTILGFTGALSGATSHESPRGARGVWIPRVSYISEYGAQDDGHRVTDLVQTISPAGHVSSAYGSERFEQRVVWPFVKRRRVKISAESTTYESFEHFRDDHILGGQSWTNPQAQNDPLRLVWDADVDGTYLECVAIGPPNIVRNYEPEPAGPNSRQYFAIALDLVKLPS